MRHTGEYPPTPPTFPSLLTHPQTNVLTAAVVRVLCRLSYATCTNILVLACGFNENQLNMTRFADYVRYQPSGTSVLNTQHWMQLLREAHALDEAVFQSFDRGDSCPARAPLFPWQPDTCNAW